MQHHLVRIGVLGQIGRFQAVDSQVHERGCSVICRTRRGLEFGTVLNVVHMENKELPRTGSILRLATPEDHLLWARIEKNRKVAFGECERLLAERLEGEAGLALMDVDLLFDGKTISFYFLGNLDSVGGELETLTTELAEAYEAKAELRKFAEAMAEGCGVDCGTGDSCGEKGGCGSCSLASACATTSSD